MKSLRLNSVIKFSSQFLILIVICFIGEVAFARDYTSIANSITIDAKSFGWAIAGALGAIGSIVVMVSRERGMGMLENIGIGLSGLIFIGTIILVAKGWA